MARAEPANPESANTLREIKSLREVYSIAVTGVRAVLVCPDCPFRLMLIRGRLISSGV